MASLLRKAARMNLMAMDFVLQVTVEELVLENLLDSRGTLTFELSRGTKASGLPPKLVTTTRSAWHQTMRIHLTLFLDKKTSRFQDKEYKLRLVQKDNRGSIVLPVLATFSLDASLYAHLGAGPSVEQQVDLYAPKLNGLEGFATVRLRVRCCEQGEGPPIGRSVSASDVHKASHCPLGVVAPRSGSLVRPRSVLNQMTQVEIDRPQLSSLQSGMLVGSSFGFSRSGSDSRHSVASTGSSAFSTPLTRRPSRSWSMEGLHTTGSAPSRKKLVGSKSFNDLDDNDSQTPLSKRGVIGPVLRSSMSFHGELLGSNGDSAGGQSPRHTIGNRQLQATGVLTSSSSSSVTDKGSKASLSPRGFRFRYDRTTTVGYNRLLARFTKGPSPRGIKPVSRGMTGMHIPLPHIPQGSSTDAMAASSSEAPPPPVLSGLQQPELSGGMLRGWLDTGGVVTVKPGATVTSSSTIITAATATAVKSVVDRKGSVVRAVSDKNVVASPSVAAGGRTRSGGHLDAVEAAATSATVGRGASVTTRTAATTTASVSTSRIGVGTSDTTVAEKANFITETLQQQRNSSSRRTSAGGSGGEAGGGGGRGGGKGANAAPPHPSNSIKKDGSRKQESLKFDRPPAHGGVGLLEKPVLNSQIPSLSVSSNSNSGGGWSLRTPHPMMGAPRSMESQESAYFGVTPCMDAAPGFWKQNEGSAGGDSAEAAPLLSSVPVIISEEANGGVGGGTGSVGKGVTGGAGWKGSSQEAMREMHTRVLHLEAALVRSELDLCRSNTELATVRQEVHALLRAKAIEEEERISSADVSALYHALEGSVVLLQIASEKMLHLENCINKYRGVLPQHVLDELEKCVTYEAVVTSPMAERRN